MADFRAFLKSTASERRKLHGNTRVPGFGTARKLDPEEVKALDEKRNAKLEERKAKRKENQAREAAVLEAKRRKELEPVCHRPDRQKGQRENRRAKGRARGIIGTYLKDRMYFCTPDGKIRFLIDGVECNLLQAMVWQVTGKIEERNLSAAAHPRSAERALLREIFDGYAPKYCIKLALAGEQICGEPKIRRTLERLLKLDNFE